MSAKKFCLRFARGRKLGPRNCVMQLVNNVRNTNPLFQIFCCIYGDKFFFFFFVFFVFFFFFCENWTKVSKTKGNIYIYIYIHTYDFS